MSSQSVSAIVPPWLAPFCAKGLNRRYTTRDPLATSRLARRWGGGPSRRQRLCVTAGRFCLCPSSTGLPPIKSRWLPAQLGDGPQRIEVARRSRPVVSNNVTRKGRASPTGKDRRIIYRLTWVRFKTDKIPLPGDPSIHQRAPGIGARPSGRGNDRRTGQRLRARGLRGWIAEAIGPSRKAIWKQGSVSRQPFRDL